jgi:hypothetical protein
MSPALYVQLQVKVVWAAVHGAMPPPMVLAPQTASISEHGSLGPQLWAIQQSITC